MNTRKAAGKIFICQFCRKVFSQTSHLKAHELIHTGEKPHVCTVCQKRFTHVSTLRQHSRRHSQETSFNCDECSLSFRWPLSLRTHKNRIHGTQNVSEYASKDFQENTEPLQKQDFESLGEADTMKNSDAESESTQLKPHKRLSKPQFACDQCDMIFSNKDTLRRHIISHTGVKPYCCTVCQKGYNDVKSLQKHKLLHSGEMPYKCDDCGMTFLWSISMKLHNRKVPENKKIPCKLCTNLFISRCHLKQHSCVPGNEGQQKSQMKPRLPCSYCGKHFSSSHAVSRHERTHTGEKPYMCTSCGRQFADISTLRNHVRTHSGEKPYKCDECDKSFLWPNRFKVHKLIHAGVPPFLCTLCGERLRTKKQLLKHNLNSHGRPSSEPSAVAVAAAAAAAADDIHKTTDVINNSDSEEERLIIQEGNDFLLLDPQHKSASKRGLPVCRYCGKQFSTSYNARAHERIHTGEKPFKCMVCPKSFSDRSSLRSHMRGHTGEKPYKCDVCQHRFRQVSNLNVHKLKHVDTPETAQQAPNEDQLTGPVGEDLDKSFSTIKTESVDEDFTVVTAVTEQFLEEAAEVLGISQSINVEFDCSSDVFGHQLRDQVNSMLPIISVFGKEEVSNMHGSELPADENNRGDDASDYGQVDDDNFESDPVVEQCLQLCSDNLPFELTVTDKLFTETSVVLERIDIPRSKLSWVNKRRIKALATSECGDEVTSHICDVCGMWFRNKCSLRRHKPLHNGVLPYTCSVCSKLFRWSIALEHHQQIMDEDSRLLCKSCGQQFESQCKFRQHSCFIKAAVPSEDITQEDIDTNQPFVLVFAPESAQYVHSQTVVNPLQCRVCLKIFRFASSRKQHETLHTGDKPYMCPTCGKRFADGSTLRNHRRTHSGIKPYKCDECGKSFLWPNRLESHKMLHAGLNPHKCKNCGETFRYRKGLSDHKEHCIAQISDDGPHKESVVEEHGVGDDMLVFPAAISIEPVSTAPHVNTFGSLFKCSYCDKQFVFKDQCLKHELKHTDQKSYKCEYCEKQFANPTCLKVHRRIHTDEKPHRCNLCGVSFRWLASLAAHLDTHGEMFPHACRSCGERFKAQRDLKEHRLQAHPTGKQDSNGSGDLCSNDSNSFSCPVCWKVFCNRYYLKKHVLVHTNEMPYKCDECGKLFRWQVSLRKHKVMDHDGKEPTTTSCKQCGLSFKSVHSLKKHSLIDHGSAKIFMCGSCPKYFMSSYAQARHEVIHEKK